MKFSLIYKLTIRLPLWCLILSSFTVNAASVQEVLHQQNQLILHTTNGKVSITALTEQSVNVWYQPDGAKQLPSFAVDPELSNPVPTKLIKQPEQWLFDLPNLRVIIQSKPLKLSYEYKGKPLVAEEIGLFHYDTLRGFRFALEPDEKIMGAGQRVLGMDRRGHRLPLYNRAHYGYTTESTQMYYSLPAIMSSKRYAIIFDNSASGFLDIGHSKTDVLQFEAVAGRTAYTVSAGDSYAELISEVVTITGKQPLPPRWALGNFASRFGYRDQQQTLDTINAFIEQDIPVDTVVLDLYWFGADIKGHMGNLSWDKQAWPAPEKMIAQLRQQGIKTVVITEPFILHNSLQWQSAVANQALAKNLGGEPRRFDFYFGNTGLVDVFDKTAQDWFWQLYQRLADQGVAGWWGDLGEPEVHPADSIHHLDGEMVTGDEIHNVYGHQWAKMVYQRQLAMSPNTRPFVMMRAGFAGSQRYGMIPWTGDVSREWGGLQSQVELALQMSLFGLAYTHSDLGGFAGGEVFDPELYTRWLQFGVFTPVYRPHAQDHIAPEPVFHADPVKRVVRDYIKLRYQLTPYNYALAHENSLTGAPFMRPLAYDFEAADIENTRSYLFGDAFLVTPVTSAETESISITLPDAVWFNYWDETRYQPNSKVQIATPIEQLPVLVKAGSFIPMVPPLNNLDSYNTESLMLHYYADESVPHSEYVFYDDDGESVVTNRQSQVETIRLQATQQGQSIQLQLQSTGDFDGRPAKRKLEWVVHGLAQKPSQIVIDNVTVNVQTTASLAKDSVSAVWSNESRKLHIFSHSQRQHSVIIN